MQRRLGKGVDGKIAPLDVRFPYAVSHTEGDDFFFFSCCVAAVPRLALALGTLHADESRSIIERGILRYRDAAGERSKAILIKPALTGEGWQLE